MAEPKISECSNDLNFEKCIDANVESGNYRFSLITLYAIKLALDNEVQDLVLACNCNNYGVFGDIVIKVLYKNGNVKLFLVNLKYEWSLQKSNGKCSASFLERCKDSYYNDVKAKILQGEQDDFCKNVEVKDIFFCLFTNAVLPQNVQNITLDEQASLSCDVLHHFATDFIDTTSEGYHIFEMVTERTYSEFFKKFRYYSDQLEYEQVIQTINSRIEESLGKFQPDVVKNFIEYIKNYFHNNHLLTKQQVKEILLTFLYSSRVSEEQLRIFQKVTNLNDPDQKLMISRHIEVVAQGRKKVTLYDIVDPFFCEKLKPEFLLKYMGEVVHVGKITKFKCENYIKRIFTKIIVEWDILWRLQNSVFIKRMPRNSDLSDYIHYGTEVIDLMNGQDLPKYFPKHSKNYVILISDEDDIEERLETLTRSIKGKVNGIHYVSEISGFLFLWRGVQGIMNLKERNNSHNIPLNRFEFVFTGRYKDLREKDLLQYYKNTINIISADAGTGKSTVLDSLISYCPSNKWTLKVNLNEWINDLKNNFHEILNDPLQYIYKKNEGENNNEFSKELFDYMKSKGAVIVFIDAFNEIPPRYISDGLKLIGKLEQLEICTWIFTRPNLRNCLEENFNTIAVQLMPLSEKDIIHYLRKNTEDNTPYLKDFDYKIRNILNIPVYLNMFSTTLYDHNYNESQFQVTDLYENFINNKYQTYIDNSGINCPESILNNLVKEHQSLALLLIYGADFLVLNEITNNYEINQLLSNINNNVGLVSTVCGSAPIFYQRSAAEYLTAKWLSLNVNHKAFKCMYERLFELDFKNVRYLFDKIITRECPLHSAVIDGDLELVQQLCKKTGMVLCDNLNRTPLHLAVSYFKSHPYYDSDKQCKSNEIACKITNEICKHFSDAKSFVAQRDILGWHWQKYAAMTIKYELLLYAGCHWGCEAVIMMYLTTKKFFFCFSKKNTIDDYYTATKKIVRGGYITCLKLLIVCNVCADIQEIKNLARRYSQSQMLVLLEALPSEIVPSIEPTISEYIWQKFQSELAYVLKFLIVNEESYRNDEPDVPENFRYFDFCYSSREFFKGRFFNARIFDKLLEDTEKKFITGTKNDLEVLEEQLGLTNVRIKLNMLDRVDVVMKMRLTGCTPLCAVAFNGCLDAVKVMAAISGYENLTSEDKFLPLYYAIEGGNVNVISWLIENGANANVLDSDGNTALSHFYKNYFLGSAFENRALRLVNGIDTNTSNAKNSSMPSLLEAIEIEKSKFDGNATLSRLPKFRRGTDLLSRLSAIKKESFKVKLELMEFFIVNGFDVTIKNFQKKSCFGWAVEEERWEIVKLFVESGFDVDYRDNDIEFTALLKSIETGCLDNLKYFLDKRADTNIKVNGMTALDLTLENERVNWETVKLLIENGANINCRQNPREYTPLHYAVQENRLDIVKYLVHNKVDVTTTSELNKRTPLQLARYLGKEDIVNFLVQIEGK